jgi:hypothetical protein
MKQFLLIALILVTCFFKLRAVSIIQAEYFWDADPGIGNGYTIVISPTTDSINFNFPLNVAGLQSGYHQLYTRTKNSNGLWSLSEGRSIYINAKLVANESFWDADPGAGNGLPTYFFASPGDSINLSPNVNTVGLSKGLHTYYTRCKNSNGVWGLAEGRRIYVVAPVIKSEYFWDNDPGVGNGLTMASFTPSDSINANTTISFAGLLGGYHSLYIRTQNSVGEWSLGEGRSIYIQPKLVIGETFWDQDPGIGMATPFTFFNIPGDSINSSSNINTAGLSKGRHRFYARLINSDGSWSLVEGRSIDIESPITQTEYFWDQDPGFGNGIPYTNFSPNDSINNIQSISTAGLHSGNHTLYIRTKNSVGEWSLSEARNIFIQSQIIGGESFWDQDPGLGNGNPIFSFFLTDSLSLNSFPPTNGLYVGMHTYYTRFKNTDLTWGLSEGRQIEVKRGTIAVEYFFDADPGIGLATSIPIIPSDSINLSNYPISTTGLSAGVHQLFIRAKSSTGVWSIIEARQLSIEIAQSNVSALEYFIDTDPGVGLGITIPISASPTIALVAGSLLNNVNHGFHSLHIRGKNNLGAWSTIESRNFITEFSLSNPVNQITKLEYFLDTDPGVGAGITIPLVNSNTGTINGIVQAVMSCATNGTHNIWLRAKNNVGVWTVVENKTITVNGITPPSIIANGSTTVCSPSTVSMNAVDSAGYGVADQWKLNGSNIFNANTNYYNASQTGSYTLQRTCNLNASTATSNVINIVVNNCSQDTIHITCMLQGFVDNGQMIPALYNQGQPNSLNDVDTVLVELHDANTPSIILFSSKQVLDLQGHVSITFPVTLVQGQAFYLVIKHRNTVETWSANPISLTTNSISYNFTNATSKAYGANQVAVGNGQYAFYAGDITQDGSIDAFDYILLDADVVFGNSGYLNTDLTGDGVVDAFDYILLDANLINGISAVTP